MSFDSLTYARRLKSEGSSEAQAGALADANRAFLVTDLATKIDIAAVKADLKTDISAAEQRLEASIEALGLRMTIRLGAMIAASVAILDAILRLN